MKKVTYVIIVLFLLVALANTIYDHYQLMNNYSYAMGEVVAFKTSRGNYTIFRFSHNDNCYEGRIRNTKGVSIGNYYLVKFSLENPQKCNIYFNIPIRNEKDYSSIIDTLSVNLNVNMWKYSRGNRID